MNSNNNHVPVHTLVPDLRGVFVSSHETDGWMPIEAVLPSNSNATPAMKSSVKVWLNDSDEVSAHYRGLVQLESMSGTCNKFRLFITGHLVQPGVEEIAGCGEVLLPSGIDWRMEIHHFGSDNAEARVILLIPEEPKGFRKLQLVLPIDEESTTEQSKAFAKTMEECYHCARVPDETVMTISLGQLCGSLNRPPASDSDRRGYTTQHQLPATRGTEDDLVADFLAVMDPALFGEDDEEDDEEEEDWN